MLWSLRLDGEPRVVYRPGIRPTRRWGGGTHNSDDSAGDCMATTHTLENGATVKVRHPLAPLGLAIVTLGIYQLVWYYKINAELRSQGENVSPGVALLAVSLGIVLIIPPFVSLYNTAERIRRVQERAG